MTTESRDPKSLLPLTSAMFEVLVSLADDDQHGYGILKQIAERTQGHVTLSTGTLYGIVKRLLADGLAVEARRRPAGGGDDPRRRYYRLTPFGRAVLTAETDRLETMVSAARAAGVTKLGHA